jgi:hypothetical protein
MDSNSERWLLRWRWYPGRTTRYTVTEPLDPNQAGAYSYETTSRQ